MTQDRIGFDSSIVSRTAHRPWPMPSAPWVMRQTWNDLLFAHWRVDHARLRAAVPPVFEIDRYDGEAWLGIVPFHMTNVGPRFVPALPGLSAFPELNVRTYVTAGGKPGVFFFSLDAASAIAVGTARALFNLPYFRAAMRVTRQAQAIVYQSRRAGAPAEFAATYEPTGPALEPTPGTLDYFLTERYCLYALDHRGRPYRLDIHHIPWRLQPATANIRVNTMADAAGLRLPSNAPLLHFSARQEMIGWLRRGF